MSSKIYDGFIFNGSLMDAHKFFMEIRKKAEIIVLDSYKKLFINELCYHYDMYFGGATLKKPNSVFSNFWKELSDRKREVNATNKLDPEVDYSFDIVLMPISTRKILGLPFTAHRELLSLLTNSEYYIKYGYWDNSDQPDGISNREWKKRAADWEKALSEFNGTPSMCGMNFSITNDARVPFFNRRELKDVAPDMYSRCEIVAKEILREPFSKAKDNGTSSITEVFYNYSRFTTYLESDQGKKDLEYTITKLALKLLPIDDLLAME